MFCAREPPQRLFQVLRHHRLGEVAIHTRLQAPGSMKSFVKQLKSDGYCLQDGRRYGKKLPVVLKRDPKLIVSAKKVKPYEYAKKCLVTL